MYEEVKREMPDIPPELLRALETGEITRDQLVELIRLEAEGLGLLFEEAVELGKRDELPKSTLGLDLSFLIGLLEGSAVSA